MHSFRLTFALLVAASSVLFIATATEARRQLDVSTAKLTGRQLAARMTGALNSVSRVEVRGSVSGPGAGQTRVVLRFVSPDRETIAKSGGLFTRVRVGKRSVDGVRMVRSGKNLYQSVDGIHWIKGRQAQTARALDAVSLNGANLPCCSGSTSGAELHLVNKGQSTWQRIRVYNLGYRLAATGQFVTGIVLLSAQSFLPLYYTESSNSPASGGSYSLNYRRAFYITVPR